MNANGHPPKQLDCGGIVAIPTAAFASGMHFPVVFGHSRGRRMCGYGRFGSPVAADGSEGDHVAGGGQPLAPMFEYVNVP